MAIIPDFFFDAVVSIGIKCELCTSWIGTGFLVGRKEESNQNYTIFLVTNYHVIEKREEILVRFNKSDEYGIKDYNICLVKNNQQLFSKHPKADIIAIQISPKALQTDKSKFNWFALDKHALGIKDMQSTGIVEGTIVYSLGFPINMVGTNSKKPICRIGCISRISNLFKEKDINEYLVDLQALPGNSGAPVINRPDSISIDGTPYNASANLIGIICGTINYYSEEDGSEDASENKLEHKKSSGMAIVHPVDIIKEVVEIEYIRVKGGTI